MVNRLCNPEDVRKKIGLSVDEAPDETLYSHIDEAQKDLLRDVANLIEDEVLSGSIDGSNNTFSTAEVYIADRNFDNTVTASDVYVYAWTNSEDPYTKSSVAVSTVYSNNGKVVLTTAPSTSVTQITADYYHYTSPIDKGLMQEACAYLAAYYFAQREILLMPQQWMHGAYRFMKSSEYKSLLTEYYKKVDRLTGVASYRGEHGSVELLRSDDNL